MPVAPTPRPPTTWCYEDLVSLFEGRNISSEFDASCAQHRAKLRALALWADEFYRTGRYLERADLTHALDGLLERASRPVTRRDAAAQAVTDGPASDRWALQIFAHGGTGKTMFVRWAVALALRVPTLDPVRQDRFRRSQESSARARACRACH